LIGSTVPHEFTNVTGGPVVLEKYVQIGANSIVMPDLTIHEGAVVGAFGFVRDNLKSWTVNVGIPTRSVGERRKKAIKLANQLKSQKTKHD
jgi:galactoside O-acetyltransferase